MALQTGCGASCFQGYLQLFFAYCNMFEALFQFSCSVCSVVSVWSGALFTILPQINFISIVV